MKILVTGATGFIGTHLLTQLVSKGFSVKAIFHEEEPKLSREIIKQIEWIKADITDIFSLQDILYDVEKIYHCVGTCSKKHSWNETKKIYLKGTQNIVNLSIAHNIKKLLYVSKPCTLHAINEQGLITEHIQKFYTHTSYNKYEILYSQVEQEIWRGMVEKVASIIINPTHILGFSHDWDSQNCNLFKQVYHNSFLGGFPLGHNGFVMIDDVINAMILLMESNIVNERFIISAENMSYQNILAFIAKEFKKPAAQIPLTKNKINKIVIHNYILHLLNTHHPIINKAKLIEMNINHQYDNSKFLNYFKHFQYQPISQNIATIYGAYKQKFRLK